MRKIALVLSLLAFSLPVYARRLPRLSTMTAGDPAALNITSVPPDLPARLLGQLKSRAARKAGVHASVITDSVSARAFIFPAAGSIAGGGGSLFFRSDVTLVNYRDTPQQVLTGFWLQGASNNLNAANTRR